MDIDNMVYIKAEILIIIWFQSLIKIINII